jgi:hypothetical protein
MQANMSKPSNSTNGYLYLLLLWVLNILLFLLMTCLILPTLHEGQIRHKLRKILSKSATWHLVIGLG